MIKALYAFIDALRSRFNEAIYTTEDSIRYTFFAALLTEAGIKPIDVILEYPHPELARSKIDVYIPSSPQRDGLVAEFKYDREMPSGANSPRPQKAGKLFHDIFRLSQFEASDSTISRWFVYVTDYEMANYMRNKSNGLNDFFMLPENEEMVIDEAFIRSKSDTFRRDLGKWDVVKLRCICSNELPNHHFVKVYQISHK